MQPQTITTIWPEDERDRKRAEAAQPAAECPTEGERQ